MYILQMIAIVGGFAAYECVVVIEDLQVRQTIVVILIGGHKQMIHLIVGYDRIAGHNPGKYLKTTKKHLRTWTLYIYINCKRHLIAREHTVPVGIIVFVEAFLFCYQPLLVVMCGRRAHKLLEIDFAIMI